MNLSYLIITVLALVDLGGAKILLRVRCWHRGLSLEHAVSGEGELRN